MRQSTVVNHENEDLMNEIIRQMYNIYGKNMNPYMVARFIGVLLVMKKHGMFETIDHNNPHLVFQRINKLNASNAMISLSCETIEEISKSVQIEVFEYIINFFAMSEFNEGEYLRLYDYCIEELSNKNTMIGQFIAPEGFATLVDAFLPSETKNIYIPFGGMMRLATDMERYDMMDSCEINHDIWALGMLRLELSYNADKVEYRNANIDSWTSKCYDAIVAMPPLCTKIQMHVPSALNNDFKQEEMEIVAPSRFAETTGETGCCITFVSASIMWATGEKTRFRKWATDNKYIDTVILLPKNLLSFTSIPTVCLILRKNSFHKDGIRMIDASDFFTNHRYKNSLGIGDIMNAYHQNIEKVSVTVSFEQVFENDYSWNVTDYLHQTDIECPEGYTLARIEDIVRFPQIKRSKDRHSGKVIQISNLSNDWTRPYVKPEQIDRNAPLRGCAMVTEDAILLSTIRTLKPSIVKASEKNPVYVSQNILVAIPCESIDAEYLCMVLAKTEIPAIGLGAPHISKTRLLRQQIAFPSIEQQRSAYKEARSASMLEQVKALHLEEVIEQMKADYINEIRSHKHDMMPHLRQMSSARKNLSYYLEHKGEFTEEELFAGMKAELHNQANAIDALSTLLSIFSRESQFGTPTRININQFFMEHYMDEPNYMVEIDTDYQALANYGLDIPETFYNFDYSKGIKALLHETPDYAEGVEVFMAEDDLKRLCDNIVYNAVKHGFTDPSRNDYKLDIRLTVESKRDMFQIDFVNNGSPLPDGMNKLRYGLRGEKAGVTGGTGEGGYIVKSIVEHYGGDYDIFCETSGNISLTTVRVLLPIYRNDEQ